MFDLGGYNATLSRPGSTLTGENENSRICSKSAGKLKLSLDFNGIPENDLALYREES